MTDNQTPARRLRHGDRPKHELYWPEAGQPRRWAALITSAGHGVLQEYGSKFEHAQPGQEMLEVMEILPSAAHKRPLDENDFHDIWEKLGGKDAFMKTFGYLQFGFAVMDEAIRKLSPAIANKAEVDLHDIEQYRIQMAAISTASLGYWKEIEGILPEYDTVPLRDVAKLYAKYEALSTPPATTGASTVLTDEQLRDTEGYKLGWMEGMQEGAELATAGEKTAADVEAEFADLLTGSYYMDPPDGGSPSVLEQVSRMAEDAAKWREVAAQAGQVAVPIYQIQYEAERGSSIWHDATEDAYHTFVLPRRRIVYAAPSPAKESK